MPLILGTNSIKDTTFNVNNSLRFDRGSSERLHFTQGSGDDTTARRKWTFSTWIKRGQLVNSSNHQYFFGVGTYTLIGFRLDGSGEADDMYIQVGTGSSAQGLHTNAKFRDPSAWMHVYVAFDSTDGTATNRLKVYINGNLVDNAYGDYSQDQRSSITQNDEDDFVGNSGDVINIGYSTNGTNSYFDGYMAETHLLIGTTKAHTEFGESNDDGVWIPKKTNFSTSDYGSNGFKLEYKQTGTSANSSGLGADTSGNNNHFSVSNLTSVDQSTDTCTNNFATLNPLVPTPDASWSEGNLKITGSDATEYSSNNPATIGVSSGKWYMEIEYDSAGSNTNPYIGICPISASATTNMTGSVTDACVIRMDNELYTEGSSTQNFFGSSISAGNIIGIALDMDNQKVWFHLNGTYPNSGNPATGSNAAFSGITSGETMTFCARALNGVFKFNFGSPIFTISSGNSDGEGHGNFEYAVPSGYFALCTKNLAEYG